LFRRRPIEGEKWKEVQKAKSYNNILRAVRNYRQQTVAGGLGTGGQLSVQGDNDTAPLQTKKKTTKRPPTQ